MARPPPPPQGVRIDYVLCTPGLRGRVASCEILGADALPPKWSDHAGECACAGGRWGALGVGATLRLLQERLHPPSRAAAAARPSNRHNKLCLPLHPHPRVPPHPPTPPPAHPPSGLLLELRDVAPPPPHPPCSDWTQLLRRFRDTSQRSLLSMFGGGGSGAGRGGGSTHSGGRPQAHLH